MTKGMTYCFINVELGGHKGGRGSVCMFVWMYVCIYLIYFNNQNYFTSSDPHHDMLGEGCQVGVVRVNWKCYFPNS